MITISLLRLSLLKCKCSRLNAGVMFGIEDIVRRVLPPRITCLQVHALYLLNAIRRLQKLYSKSFVRMPCDMAVGDPAGEALE